MKKCVRIMVSIMCQLNIVCFGKLEYLQHLTCPLGLSYRSSINLKQPDPTASASPPECSLFHEWKGSFFSCDQAALQMAFSVCLSVRPSVRPSVCHTFFTMFPSSYHHEFSGIITNDQSKVHAKGHGQRSKVKVTEVKTQLNRFRTVTPVWIHIW